jgi:hypothetical protein
VLVPDPKAFLAADEARFALRVTTHSGDGSALDRVWWPRSRDLATEPLCHQRAMRTSPWERLNGCLAGKTVTAPPPH